MCYNVVDGKILESFFEASCREVHGGFEGCGFTFNLDKFHFCDFPCSRFI